MSLFQNDDISINTIVGPGSAVSGDVRVTGFARVDGDIDGNLETTGKLIIGEKARIRGNISAQSVAVGGIVEGDIAAPEFVKIFATSAVTGDVTTHRLEIAEEGVFHGHCIALKNTREYDKAVGDRRDVRFIQARTNKR
jgi:cytoskeletal protein CcmA (bactofilin family)